MPQRPIAGLAQDDVDVRLYLDEWSDLGQADLRSWQSKMKPTSQTSSPDFPVLFTFTARSRTMPIPPFVPRAHGVTDTLCCQDDKQVSPTVVGTEERQIIQLRETYLKVHPLRDQLEPSTSLYDLVKIAFPGKVIMLREHFRCVEPIIRFSSQFYGGKLVPLRLPTATERLDPPLIDILVRDGRRVREVNEAEANVIVEEIRKLTEDPKFANRSIGVISLVGEKQAKLIHDRLLRDIGFSAMNRHRIMCGKAATFQGQERDITFLSMVECPETTRAKASRVFEQRFNVALSRARDRMVHHLSRPEFRVGLEAQGHRAFPRPDEDANSRAG